MDNYKDNFMTIDPTMFTTVNDPIKPDYYMKSGVECYDVIKAAVSDLNGIDAFYVGNAMKYLWRYKQKNGKEDLKKAREYIDKLIGQ